MKFTENDLDRIRNAVLDSMTMEKCTKIVYTITKNMQNNPEFNDPAPFEKILWIARMAYVTGYMNAIETFTEAMELEQPSENATVIS